MFKKLVVIAVLSAFWQTASANAQPVEVSSTVDKLAFLLPQLYGPQGLFVDTEFRQFNHQAHFNSAFQTEFSQFNIAFSQQLTAVPLPSNASGFTYEFDPAVGAFTRSTQSFGPILTERAETIGARRSSFGFTYQYFKFDRLGSADIDEFPAVFVHDDNPGFDLAFEDDLVTTVNAIDAELNQFVFFYTYGLSNRLDVSLAIPVVSADMSIRSEATIRRISESDRTIHFYEETGVALGDQRHFRASGTASGIGDIVLRLKGTAVQGATSGLGLGMDVRFPTGDEQDLLGSGAWGLKPLVALSFSRSRFSPHANFSYQWNGESVLAGDILVEEKADMPDQVLYAFGVDLGVSEALTVVVDFLGQRMIDSARVVFVDFAASDGSTFSNLEVREESFNVFDLATGFKVNVAGSLLVDFNLLFKLNDEGLRDNITPLIGLEFSF